MRLTQEYTVDIEHRFKYATVAVLVLFAVVAGRLYYLQVIRGSFYRFFSTENSIKEINVPAVRGMMFDRKGRVLVENRPAFNIVITPQYVTDPNKTFSALSELLGMPQEALDAIWEKRKLQAYYQPLVVKSDVSENEAAVIRARKNPWSDLSDKYDLRSVDVELNYERSYPEDNIASHLLGYVREVDPEKLKKFRETNPGKYRMGDLIGIEGLEERWDDALRGTDGFKERIVNAAGREVAYEGIAGGLEDRDAVAGASLKLTIDRDLQTLARDLFGGKKGAVVAIDVKTGGIVAMYSSPSYNLTQLAGRFASAYWNEISTSPDRYLLNRAIQGGYPPGSTYKVVTAIAALSEEVVGLKETVNCSGALMYGGRAYHCWRKGGHGAISLHKAIVSSCDVYFYLMGLRLGVDGLAKYANIMGLGAITGVPILGERSGLIPTSAWKEKRYGVPWQEGETLSISVGQGYNVVTPIQNALVAAEIANGGRKLELHFVDSAYDTEGKEIYRWAPPAEGEQLPLNSEIIRTVREGMVGVVKEPDGTAHRQSLRKVTMGGKTGTAQVIQLDGSAVCKSDVCKDHAWFIGFAPAADPQISAAVVVEHGGFGASAAAPIVGALFEKYFESDKSGSGLP